MRMLERVSGFGLGLAALLAGFMLGRDQAQRSPGEESERHAPAEGHETRDLSIPGVIVFGVCLLIALGLTFGIVSWMTLRASGRPFQLAPPEDGLADKPDIALPAEPRLEAAPGQSLAELRTRHQAQLHEYRWISRENGTVQIPIDRAIAILAERGLPTRQTGESSLDDATSSPSSASSGRVLEREAP